MTTESQSNWAITAKWGELYHCYRATDRGCMVKSIRVGAPYHYYSTLGAYVFTAVVIVLLAQKNALAFMLTIPMMGCLYFWSNFAIRWYYKPYYERCKLQLHPYSHRIDLLHYILFTEKLFTSEIISAYEIEKILQWNRHEENKASISFINAPLTLLILTVGSTVTLEYMKVQRYLTWSTVVVIIMLIAIILYISWSAADLFQTTRNTNREICNFLKKWEIEGRDK
jgi:hypothetical protein